MKTIHWLLIVAVIVIIGGGFLLYNKLKKNIAFDFNVGNNFSDILGLLTSRYDASQRTGNKAGLYFDIPLTTIVKNNGAAKVVLQNLSGSVSYNGEPILQTKANSAALANVEVPKKDSKVITDNVQLLVNESTIKFFKELLKGKMPNVIYNFSTVIAGKPKNFTNSTQVNKEKGETKFDANGNPIDPNLRAKCSPNCLTAYPQSSQYYGYYYCKSNCASFL